MFNNYNPYFGQQRPPQQQFDLQQSIQPYMPQTPLTMPKNNILQGKSVDSIEVVRATDIPMDGSVSYFPLSDGSAIITKQLQMDGSSKIVIYKPFENKETPKEEIIYITKDDLDNKINELNVNSINEELSNIKKELKELKELKKGSK